jgi:hypothetical protein
MVFIRTGIIWLKWPESELWNMIRLYSYNERKRTYLWIPIPKPLKSLSILICITLFWSIGNSSRDMGLTAKLALILKMKRYGNSELISKMLCWILTNGICQFWGYEKAPVKGQFTDALGVISVIAIT